MISLVTGVAFGLAPALKATRVDLVPTLRGDGETRSPEHRWLTLKNALVVFQVAVSVVLLGGTSIFLQMLSASRDAARRLCGRRRRDARNGRALRGLLGDRGRATRYEEIRRRIAAIPGVQAAVLTRGLPMQTDGRAGGRRRRHGDAGPDALRRRRRRSGRDRAIFDMLRIPDPVRPGARRAGSPRTRRASP